MGCIVDSTPNRNVEGEARRESFVLLATETGSPGRPDVRMELLWSDLPEVECTVAALRRYAESKGVRLG